jgi:hypothetical protein
LIDPNPNSALNEEAGKLILEDYPAYYSQARLFTEVHALKSKRTATPNKPALKTTISAREDLKRSAADNSIPLASSQAQNTDVPDSLTKPKLLLIGIGFKRLEDEDGDENTENRPAKRIQGNSRAGKAALRRL